MAKNIDHVQHIKSTQIVDGAPKLPTVDSLKEGEIAINLADGYETLSIKNTKDEIVRFSSDDYYTLQKLGTAFTASTQTVTDAINNVNGITKTAFDFYSGQTKIQIDSKLNTSDFKTYSSSTETALNDKLNIDDFQSYSSDTKSLIDGKVGNNVYTAYTSATESVIDGKLDTSAFTAYSSTTKETIDTISTDLEDLSGSVISSEKTLTTAVDELGSSKADYASFMALAENVRVLTESVDGGSFVKANDFGVYSGAVKTSLESKVDNSTYETYTAATNSSIANKQDISGFTAYTSSTDSKINTINTTLGTKLSSDDLKTINGESIVGSGDITIDMTIYKVVTELPTSDVEENKIYLVLSSESGESDKYTEYAYINNAWEKFGTYKADVDLTPYLKSSDAASTYLSQTAASNTYLTKTAASNTYLAQISAKSTYISSVGINGKTVTITKGDGTSTTATTQDTTYSVASQTADGLMTMADKKKLDSIAEGAQVNTVTGIKGSAETTYRQGQVNITAANIGLGNVDNTSDASKSVKYATSAGTASTIDGKSVSDLDARYVQTTPFTAYSANVNTTIETLSGNVVSTEEVLTTAVNELKSEKADNAALMALAEQMRSLIDCLVASSAITTSDLINYLS